MSDIITRLLLKTNDFDANLNRSKASVSNFQGDIANVAKTAGAGIAKFAGGIGLAMGAFESFDKLIHSSQGTQDAFEWRMAACKDTVDAFFHSLSSGDFTAFNQGIASTYGNMIRLQQLRDDLADAKISNNVFRAQYQNRAQELKAIISDNTSSKKEKKDAAVELKKITEAYSEQLSSTNDINIAQMLQNAQTKTGRYYSKEDIIRFFKVYNNPASLDNRKAGFDKFVSTMNKLKKKEYHYETRTVGTGMNATTVTHKVANPEVQKQIQQLQKENNELDRMYVLSQHNDKTWEELSSSVIDYFAMQGEAAQNLNFLVKQNNKANKPDNNESPAENSLGWYNSQLSELNKKLIAETDIQARGAIQATINELEQKKINLKIVTDNIAFKTKYGDLNDSNLLKVPSLSEREEFNINKKLKGLKLNNIKFDTPIKKKDIDLNNQYNESLSAMGSIMGNLSGAFDGNTASIFQWGSTLFSTIGQAIPAILSMVPAKKASAAASKEEATAEVLNAGAKSMEAHAGIPFAGIAIGLAGVAAIIAAMASMPKFAGGGVVPGVSFTGDKVPAWLNSGEMILNRGQQGNLFKLLNNSLYGGLSTSMTNVKPRHNNLNGLIIPSESDREIKVTGDFRVKGCDLELVLKNQTHKKSKVR